ncbi:retention in endoplasmic reticulum 1 like protein [Tieghemostelium lacteum]|uniref:Protein RER1 n=1 Tax=Tieghemostelium lacteum TaxID=361077 RepID=A0A151Z3N2_TIELA|nr:retention in endoplasmic reticulum 1 like protein [Tieghemostelium lacteum]|eukprot:KYQ88570.1 retention in endoplasmic reticulum 1 like protein [Tieghemostelium lacteum]
MKMPTTTIYEGEPTPSDIISLKTAIERKYKDLLDRTTKFLPQRWAFFGFLVFVYLLRVYISDGRWHVVTYAIGVYILTLSIAFLSPKWDPELEDGEFGTLPTTSHSAFNTNQYQDPDDVKPFVRRLPEFKYWLSCSKSIIYGLFATFFPILDLPVFWPLLLVYFFVITFITMKKQINHMIKYKYLPFTQGKKVYPSSRGN